jgi:hypothetical protein
MRGKFRLHGCLFIGENPSTRSGRGDDLGSISNWKEITSDCNGYGKGMNSVGYEFVTNSALEPLRSGTLGCDVSVATGPWCRLAGPPLRGARPRERAGRAGPAAMVNGGGRPTGLLGLDWATREWGRQNWLPAEFRPTAKIKLKIPFLFQNLFIICKLF